MGNNVSQLHQLEWYSEKQVRQLCVNDTELFDKRIFHLLKDEETGRVSRDVIVAVASDIFRYNFRGRVRISITMNVRSSVVVYKEELLEASTMSTMEQNTVEIPWTKIKEWLGIGDFADTGWYGVCSDLGRLILDLDNKVTVDGATIRDMDKNVDSAKVDFSSLNWSSPKSAFSNLPFKLNKLCRLQLAHLVVGHIKGRFEGARKTFGAELRPLNKLHCVDRKVYPSKFIEACAQGDALLVSILHHAEPEEVLLNPQLMLDSARAGHLDVMHVLYGCGGNFLNTKDNGEVDRSQTHPVDILEDTFDATLLELGLPDEEFLIESAEGTHDIHAQCFCK